MDIEYVQKRSFGWIEKSLMLAPAVITVLLYASVTGLGYVWDDKPLFISAPKLRDLSSLWLGITDPVIPDTSYFRPLALLSFKLQFWLAGDGPAVSHLVSLALHGLNTLLVTLVASRLVSARGLHRRRALIAGLFYGIHPALVEPVAWVSARFDLLMTALLLAALCAELQVRRPALRGVTVSACFALALMTKEMAVTFPVLLLLVQSCARWPEVRLRDLPATVGRKEGLTYALVAAVVVGYALMRLGFVGRMVHVDPDISQRLDGPADRLAFFVSTVVFYMRLVVWPFTNLNPLHQLDMASLGWSPRVVPALIITGTTALLLCRGVARRNLPLTLLAGGLVSLLPVLNIVPLEIARNIGHERFLTFPLCFAAWALAATPWPRLPGLSHRIVALSLSICALAWAGACAANVRVTLPLWRTDVSLWQWALAKNPQSDYALFSLVAALLNAGHPEAARQFFEEPVPRTAYRGAAQLMFGRYLVERGRSEEGLLYLTRAFNAFPTWNRPPASAEERWAAGAFRTHLAVGHASAAKAQLDLRHYAEAATEAEIALHYQPGMPSARAVLDYARSASVRDLRSPPPSTR